ncbi:hypothetical protein AG1IA_07045 [Rhizoctonia solani AG-1 IA]|uniref:BTB domain-containing protein n=1 Tax=Thanatephorus cucumeris (strain AG1-IA) TaxID=983506 RepID=L8WQ76_THACA|nr:hypothetical protein AG1IA_07045 [Rhizoctonia solani AG-1 IA]
MDYEPKYTVIMRGQEFVLTKSQIEFDSPNYFSSCFLGDFREAQSRSLELCRNPDLFRIIVEYLCGYEVLPLNDKLLPSFMSTKMGLENLRIDALFYQLEGLVKACETFAKPRISHRVPKMSFMLLGYTARNTNILSDTAPKGISVRDIAYLSPEKDHWYTIVTEDVFVQIEQLQSPNSYNDFQGFRIVAAMEGYTRKMAGNYRQNGWKFAGWRIENVAGQGSHRATEILVVLASVVTPKD